MKVDSELVFDERRRRWLIATSVAGGLGGVAVLVPFVDSFAPSASAKAAGAPVDADIDKLMPGSMMTVAWRGKPVFIVNRTREMMAAVIKADPMVADPHTEHPFSMPLPDYCLNEYRSRTEHPNILVVVGVCTWTRPCITGHAVTLRLVNFLAGETRVASGISGRCADAIRCSG
jgi:ubiquinol-cytochrome c reductase iron-sulfur subunit